MKTNGVLVNENDIVTRGTAIGLVGNTGYSTNPHLHFQDNNQGGVTNPSCFEAGVALSNQITKCYLPVQGGFWNRRSN
jgi:murein DD-endopeptidase MepM/ murein hydrolase activator NlpD